MMSSQDNELSVQNHKQKTKRLENSQLLRNKMRENLINSHTTSFNRQQVLKRSVVMLFIPIYLRVMMQTT